MIVSRAPQPNFKKPFGLSLSKPCLFFCTRASRKRQPFDKLRVNGLLWIVLTLQPLGKTLPQFRQLGWNHREAIAV